MSEDRPQAQEYQSELALQAALLDLTFDAILVRDFATDTIQFWNRGAEELYGFARDDVIGRVSHDVLQTSHPIPIEEAKRILVETGRWEGELIHTKRNGAHIVVHSRWAVRMEEERPVAILETNTDITERVRADRERVELLAREQAARAQASAILSQMTDGVILCDPNGVVTFVNDTAQRLYGLDFTGRSLADYTDSLSTVDPRGPSYEREALPLQRALTHGEVTIDAEARLRRADGSEIIVLRSATPVTAEDGTRLGAVLTVRDVTPQRSLEQQKEEFLSAAAHDLKTPLTSLKALAQLLQRRLQRDPETDPAGLLDWLQRIEQNANRMTAMIDELLDVSRLQMGAGVELNRRPMDLVALVARCVAEYHETTGTDRVALQSRTPELIGVWDAVRLERVIANLLSNAGKYSPPDAAITVTVGDEERDGAGWAVVSVQDRGIGIPEDDLPHIFERFHRGQNVGQETLGAGIGLSGVRQIVESHNGTIEVTSKEGVGSTFTVRLPLEREENAGES
jgi:PAS domain S-box-containing protein